MAIDDRGQVVGHTAGDGVGGLVAVAPPEAGADRVPGPHDTQTGCRLGFIGDDTDRPRYRCGPPDLPGHLDDLFVSFSSGLGAEDISEAKGGGSGDPELHPTILARCGRVCISGRVREICPGDGRCQRGRRASEPSVPEQQVARSPRPSPGLLRPVQSGRPAPLRPGGRRTDPVDDDGTKPKVHRAEAA